MLRLCALVVCGAVLAGSGASAECVAVHRTIAERWQAASFVFVADVLGVETVILDPEPFVYRVRLRVLEAYKGASTGEQTFDVASTPDDYLFKAGQRVLVYAVRNQKGKFSTSCTSTR